jgi:hypothetical protein
MTKPLGVLGETRPAQISIRSSGGVPTLDETYHFLVRAPSKETSRFNVARTTGLPIVGVTLSSFGYSVCKSKVAVRREDQPDLWDVTCEFSSQVDENQSNQDPSTEPTEWIPIYETKFERISENVSKDIDGDAVANSAGQPFDTGIIISRFIPVWEFFQFESATVTDETIIGRNEKLNNGTFRGRAEKTLLLTVMSSVVGFYYGQRRRLTQYQLKYNERTWRHKRLDVGTVYKSGTDLLPYTDKDGNVILGGLNGSGAKVAVGTAPSVLDFDIYESISFSFLRT